MKTKGSVERVALFPLKMFLLPGSFARLFIFEERYQQLIHDCEDGMAGFGIAYNGVENPQKLGCWVELHEIEERYPSGEMNIVVHCTSLYRLNEFNFRLDDKLYPGGEVEFIEAGQAAASTELLTSFKAHLLKSDISPAELLTRDELDHFTIANELTLSDSDKLELAGLESGLSQDKYLINYLRYLNLLEKQEQSVFQNIYLN